MKAVAAIVTLVLLMVCGTLPAAPAHWYKWRSKVDGQLFCTQTPPGPGWERLDQAYADAQCRRAVASH